MAGLVGLVLAVAVAVAPASAAPELAAFPGAEGFGAGATGGRGGEVVIVDTLEPFGPGSLGEALDPEECGPRIVVFRVSGVIEVEGKHDLELTCGNLTIAGQTAPGAGITLNGRIDGYGAAPGGNIIIRHLRLRPPPLTDEEGAVDDVGAIYDALQLSNNPNMMLDHLSLSWGSDETFDLFEFASDVTVQWTTVEQSNPEGQVEGPHNHGFIAGPDSPRVTLHHVLFAHHRSRCPALATGPAELINSVVYDCQDGFVHNNPAEGEFHIIGNTFIHGPSHEEFTPLYFDDEDPGGTTYLLSQNDIQAPGQFEGVIDDISDTPLAEAAFAAGAEPDQIISSGADFSAAADNYVPVSTQAPAEAFEAVLEQAGAFPRDVMTSGTIQEVLDGSGNWEPDRSIDLLDGLTPADPPADEDDDGMADDWEADHGLDPTDGDDHTTLQASGYTAIEEYVNELSAELIGAAPPEGTVETPVSDEGGAGESDEPATAPAPSPAASSAAAATDDDDSAVPLAAGALVFSAVAAALSAYTLYLVRQLARRSPLA